MNRLITGLGLKDDLAIVGIAPLPHNRRFRFLPLHMPCRLTRVQAQLTYLGQQLAVNIMPLAHPQPGQELFATELAQFVLAKVAGLFMVVVPNIQPGDKIGTLMTKTGMVLIGRLLGLLRTIPWVLHAQRGDDDQHLMQAALLGGGQQHTRQTRIQRQTRQATPQRGQLLRLIQRPQLMQQAQAILDVTLVRGIDEGKLGDLAQAHGLHFQDHRRQIGAPDLRIGKGGTVIEVLLGIEADTDPSTHPATTPGTLIGRGLGDRLNRQALNLGTMAVTTDTR